MGYVNLIWIVQIAFSTRPMTVLTTLTCIGTGVLSFTFNMQLLLQSLQQLYLRTVTTIKVAYWHSENCHGMSIYRECN